MIPLPTLAAPLDVKHAKRYVEKSSWSHEGIIVFIESWFHGPFYIRSTSDDNVH